MNQTIRVVLHVLVAIVTMTIGVALVAIIQLMSSLFLAPLARASEETVAPLPVLRPLESVTVPNNVLELSCYDLHILPIWNELKKDPAFKDWINGRGSHLNCSELLNVTEADLNRDGTDEFLVAGKDFQLCSAVGNCGFWILEVKRSRARILLSSTDYLGETSEIGHQVQSRRSRGYSNILLKSHFSAAETGYTTYSFDGKRYVESRCVYEVPKYGREGERSMELISCIEFDRRLQSEP